MTNLETMVRQAGDLWMTMAGEWLQQHFAVILAVTLLHWSDFMAVGLPHQPVWMFDYLVDPLLGVAVIHFAGLWPPWRTRRSTPAR